MPPKKQPRPDSAPRKDTETDREEDGVSRGSSRRRIDSGEDSEVSFLPRSSLAFASSVASTKVREPALSKLISYAEPLLISVCNFKGGVGKTTSLYEIAAKYHQQGYRVLMVDADPQCSLTSRVFDLSTLVGGEEVEGSLAYQKRQWNEARARSQSRTTIFHLFEGLLRSRDAVDVALSLPNYETIGREATPIRVPYAHNDGFKIIPGSIELLRMDESLPSRAGQEFNGFLNLPETMTHIFRKIATDQGFDLVFIDLSPAISRWNRAILLGSDYVYIPFMPSVFCYETTQEILRELIREKRALQPLYNNVPGDRGWTIREDRGPYGRVKLIGTFMQAARGSRRSKDDIEAQLFTAYDEWRLKIYSCIQALMPQMREVGLVRGKFFYSDGLCEEEGKALALHKGNLPEGVKDFCSAGLKAQSLGVPLIHAQTKSDQQTQARRYFGIILEMFKKNAGSRFPTPEAIFKANEEKESLKASLGDLGHYRLWYNTDLVNALIASYATVGNDRFLFPGTDPALDLNAHAFYYLDGARLVLGNTADVLTDLNPSQSDVLRERIEFHTGTPPYSGMHLLMPLNLDGRHFTLLMLRCRGGLGGPVVWDAEYFDPQGVSEGSDPIVRRLRALGYTVLMNDRAYQEDNYNCGAWIVEAARIAMGRGHLPVGPHGSDFTVPNIYARRNEHQERIPDLFDAYIGGSKALPSTFLYLPAPQIPSHDEDKIGYPAP